MNAPMREFRQITHARTAGNAHLGQNHDVPSFPTAWDVTSTLHLPRLLMDGTAAGSFSALSLSSSFPYPFHKLPSVPFFDLYVS